MFRLLFAVARTFPVLLIPIKGLHQRICYAKFATSHFEDFFIFVSIFLSDVVPVGFLIDLFVALVSFPLAATFGFHFIFC